jgi:hypothetical protein
LSVVVTSYACTLLHWPWSAFTVRLSGQVMVGGWLSFTVNVTTQVSLLAGDALSVTVTVTGMVMPSETPL